MLMTTKGIRQAEGESPYTVKTNGAICWKEGRPDTPDEQGVASGCAVNSEMGFFFINLRLGQNVIILDPAQYRGPPSFQLQLHNQLKQQVLLLFIGIENKSSVGIEGPCRALTHVGFSQRERKC